MKKNLFALIPCLALSLLAMETAIDPLAIGAAIPKPEQKMKDISGRETSFNDCKKENGLLVMFICNTCPVVAKYQARTVELAKYAEKNKIGVILLNSNEATREDGESFSDMQTYGKEQGFTFSYVLDDHSAMANAFGAARTPEIFLFDKNAKLAYHGAIDDNMNGADQVTRRHAWVAIDEQIAGKEITTKQTRSVGCGIKRAE